MWNELNSNIIDNKIVYYYKNDQLIGKYIREGNWFDVNIIDIIKKNRIPNKDILDIGAFIGTVSLRLYDLIKDEVNTKIHSFEPRYYKCLKKNININKMSDKIILYEYGLANNNGYINDHLNNNPDIVNLGGQALVKLFDGSKEIKIKNIIEEKKKNDRNYKFKLKKLDDLKLNNIGFIKIDIEGMEIEAIKGSINTLKKNNYPPLYIELLAYEEKLMDPTKAMYDKNSKKVLKILNNLGYKCEPKFIKGISRDYLFTHCK